MADDVTLPGTGDVIAADDVGSKKYQKIKVTWGPDNTVNEADVASGKSFPAQIRSATGLIPIGEPTDAKSAATDATSVTAISIWKQISASVQSMVAGLTVSGTIGATIADGSDAALGTTTGTKVVTDAAGTVQQYLRGLVAFFANALGAGTAAAAHRTTLASDDPAVATLGATSGAKVITDANGSLQQYARGQAARAHTNIIRSTPTVSATPDYSIDDVLGAAQVLTGSLLASGVGGVLNSIVMTCKVDIPAGVTVDILLFDRNPTNSTFTDNAALAVNVADLPFMLPHVPQLTARVDLGTPAALMATGLGIPVLGNASADLYYVAVVRGAATLNLASTSDIAFVFGFLGD